MAVSGEKLYVPALMGASGITKEQAKTCLYYTTATYLIPDKVKRMPLLTIMGPHGTGKTMTVLVFCEPENTSFMCGK